MDFILTPEKIAEYKADLQKAKPYPPDADALNMFDFPCDVLRMISTLAMEQLKDAGLWTAEDEKNAFG